MKPTEYSSKVPQGERLQGVAYEERKDDTMYLNEHVQRFVATKSPDELAVIYEEHGKKGFSLACKAAGISRAEGRGKKMLDIYDPTVDAKQLSAELWYKRRH